MTELLSKLGAGFKGFFAAFRSPGEPMRAAAPMGTMPVAWDYPYGYNQNVKPGETEITFEDLRALADGYDLLRLAIEKRKNQVEALDWNIVPTDKRDPVAQRISDEVYQFFRRPDRLLAFGRWQRQLVEDAIVIDAPAIYVRRNLKGGVYGFEAIDGATIKCNIDETGRTPPPPYPAYQQIIEGMPAVDLTTDDLLYYPRNRRTHKVYGYSPVAQVVMTVNIAIRRQMYQLGYYTEGNIPEAFVSCPADWGLEQITAFQAYWDALFARNQSLRRKARFVPAGAQPTFYKENPLKDQFDEWLARIISYCMDLPPTALVKETNRATAETQQDAGKSEGVAAFTKYLKEIYDILIQDYMGFPNIEFKYMEEEAQKPLEQAQVNEIYVRSNILTVDEVREDLGRDPRKEQEASSVVGKVQKVQRGKRRELPPVKPDLRQMERVRKRFAKALQSGFAKLKPELSRQVAEAYTKGIAEVGKLEDKVREKLVSMILDELDYDGWAILFDDAAECLAEVAICSGALALQQLELASKDITKFIDLDALNWARERAAEMVGKKWDGQKLIDNPNPKWAITDGTRDYLRGTVSKAVKEGWSPQKLAKEIEDDETFWQRRADMIARTELNAAHAEGNLIGWRQSGVVGGKRSLCLYSEDYTGTDPCPANADAGVIALDDLFPSGQLRPPFHPNCKCVLIPVLDEA